MIPFASLLAVALVASPGPISSTRKSDDFTWHGKLSAGKTLEIIGVNGSIDATGASGSDAEVTAVKSGRKSDPDEVRIQVVEHEGGVTICAVYPTPRRREENECLPNGKGRNNTSDNDVKVRWTVRVPRDVRFAGRTVNGEVSALGLTADAELTTVNGSITVETTSWATASTVNGSISAHLGSTGWRGDAEFETVNGGITIDLPAGASADVDASTVNGSMSTDFPLTVRGRWGPRRMSGKIGEGGRGLSLTTVNGDMHLRRTP